MQGTGSTVVKVSPDGTPSLFFQGQPGLGLTTALGVLKEGFVIVGSVPTTDGTAATIKPGQLLVLDRFGHQVASISSHAPERALGPDCNNQGDHPQVFVSNVLSGTVTRIDLEITDHGQKGQGLIES